MILRCRARGDQKTKLCPAYPISGHKAAILTQYNTLYLVIKITLTPGGSILYPYRRDKVREKGNKITLNTQNRPDIRYTLVLEGS
jgi:hypothetical protein